MRNRKRKTGSEKEQEVSTEPSVVLVFGIGCVSGQAEHLRGCRSDMFWFPQGVLLAGAALTWSWKFISPSEVHSSVFHILANLRKAGALKPASLVPNY